jgi:hypothetical protein
VALSKGTVGPPSPAWINSGRYEPSQSPELSELFHSREPSALKLPELANLPKLLELLKLLELSELRELLELLQRRSYWWLCQVWGWSGLFGGDSAESRWGLSWWWGLSVWRSPSVWRRASTMSAVGSGVPSQLLW